MVVNFVNSPGIVGIRPLVLMVGVLVNGCFCPINSSLAWLRFGRHVFQYNRYLRIGYTSAAC